MWYGIKKHRLEIKVENMFLSVLPESYVWHYGLFDNDNMHDRHGVCEASGFEP